MLTRRFAGAIALAFVVTNGAAFAAAKDYRFEASGLNILHRLLDGKSTSIAAIDAPQALSLRREPKANVARYDALRGKEISRAS